MYSALYTMRFSLIIDVKGANEGEITRRLRAALKCLLRSFGIRVTACVPTPPMLVGDTPYANVPENFGQARTDVNEPNLRR